MLELRTLTADDWSLWRELRLAALAEAPYAFCSTLAEWQGDGDREDRWRGRLSVPDAHDLVAFLGGRPVGMCSGVPVDGDVSTAELISLWVSPAARGHGVADGLIDAIARWAGARGARTLRLSVRPDNAKATALYLRHGFADTGEAGEALPDGSGRERVMAKPLA
jgi:ribosomal protein S18 acetylase RimI-like enzyme